MSTEISPRGKLITLLIFGALIVAGAFLLWALWSRQKAKAEPPGVFAQTVVLSVPFQA